MDFYNKNFHQLIRHVDPSGMLNVAFNVFVDSRCLKKYLRTDNDFRKLDIPWMCDQLIILLANYDFIVNISSDFEFLHNDLQRRKYPFVLISQAFFGLVLIQESSVKAFISHCRASTISLYQKKITLVMEPKKGKEKTSDVNVVNNTNQPHQGEIIQNLQIGQLEKNQVLVARNNEKDVLLIPSQQILHNQNTILNYNGEVIGINVRRSDIDQQQLIIQPNEEFPVLNQNCITENRLLPRNVSEQHFMNIDIAQSKNVDLLQFEEPRHSLNVFDKPIQVDQLIEPTNIVNLQEQPVQTEQLTVQPKEIVHVQETFNKVSTENDVSQNNLLDRPKKRKIFRIYRAHKKRRIEKSRQVLVNQMKKLEGQLLNRPLEYMAKKYMHQSIEHLPLRYAMHRNTLNLPFVTNILNLVLEENENQEDVLNNTMTMINYKTISDKLNHDASSIVIIYQQSMNIALPHLELLPPAEDSLNDGSLIFRDTINEMNKKLDYTYKGFSRISKIDLERLQLRVHQSLVPQKTLIDPEISHLDLPSNIVLPSRHQIEELLNNNSIVEPQNAPEVPHANIEKNGRVPSHDPPIVTQNVAPELLIPEKSCQTNDNHEINAQPIINQFEQDNIQNFQNNIEPVQVYQRQSIDVRKIIINILNQPSVNVSYLKFTDLCPLRVTNRRSVAFVFIKCLRLNQEKVIKLSQPFNTTHPSSISIEIINYENIYNGN